VGTIVGGAVRTAPRPTRRSRRIIWAAAASALVLFTVVTARVFVWPDLRPLPDRVDAIIELAGPGDDSRDQVALDLARQHRAPVLVQSTIPGDARCLPAVQGVTIECFHALPNTTRGEARYIGQLAEQRHWTSVILVTTPDQAWRARLRVSRCFDGQIYNATAHLPFWMWFRQIPYQWFASAKALTIERGC
jgi:hypothetical protein